MVAGTTDYCNLRKKLSKVKLLDCEVTWATLRIDILSCEVTGQYKLWSDLAVKGPGCEGTCYNIFSQIQTFGLTQ